MKKSEFQQLIKENIVNILKEENSNWLNDDSKPKKETEWREIELSFSNALDEIQSHDRYSYANSEEVKKILYNLISEIDSLI